MNRLNRKISERIEGLKTKSAANPLHEDASRIRCVALAKKIGERLKRRRDSTDI